MKATNTTFGASFFVFSFLVVVVIENQYGENSELILFIDQSTPITGFNKEAGGDTSNKSM